MKIFLIVCLYLIAMVPAFAVDQPQQLRDPADVTIGKPVDISQEMFTTIRTTCARRWSTDYAMRVFCERKQFRAVRILRGEKGEE